MVFEMVRLCLYLALPSLASNSDLYADPSRSPSPVAVRTRKGSISAEVGVSSKPPRCFRRFCRNTDSADPNFDLWN
jgi:hypothetical protein